MTTNAEFNVALTKVDELTAGLYNSRDEAYNHGHSVPDYFRRGAETCLDLCFIKLTRIEDQLGASKFNDAQDSCLDLVNYARFLAALQILSTAPIPETAYIKTTGKI